MFDEELQTAGSFSAPFYLPSNSPKPFSTCQTAQLGSARLLQAFLHVIIKREASALLMEKQPCAEARQGRPAHVWTYRPSWTPL